MSDANPERSDCIANAAQSPANATKPAVRPRKPPVKGDVWQNRHTGRRTTVLDVGPAPLFDGQVRVLTEEDMVGGEATNNGWSAGMFMEHWEPVL